MEEPFSVADHSSEGSSPSVPTASRGAAMLELDADPTVNFAMQQNDVPVIKALRVKNDGDLELRGLEVAIRCEPAFAAPWTARIDSIAPASTYNLPPIDLELSAQFLLDLSERLAGTIHIDLKSDGAVIAALSRKIEILARDEWSGLRSLPEILAAFVLPNHPAVEKILASAASILESWTGDAALSGYQSKSPDRALKMVGAIFAAMHQLNLSYINPPTSFEQAGQKIRLPDRMLENRMGTCLDLALLIAACMEQAGMNPLVALVEGHAFAGVWLIDDSFPDISTDDPAGLRKRIDLGELAFFETTLLTHPDASFDRSQAEARVRLNQDETFHCAVDIRRARKGRIRPLPLKAEGGEIQIVIGERRPRRDLSASAPELKNTAEGIRVDGEGGVPGAAETPATRLDRWKRKLLDLTMHNRLLNFKESKKTLPILCFDLGSLEDALADGEKFVVGPRPPEMEEGPRSAELHRQRTGEDIAEALLAAEFKSRRLHADLTQIELDRRLLEVFRASKSSIEESGANPLYLALGFLQWYESPASAQSRIAPIILIPLEVERKLVKEGFRIRQGDDEPMVNITLLEILARDYGIAISGLDPLPQDDHGIDVRKILTVIRRAIRDVPRWDVVENAHIGLFTFTKHLMWRDLQARTDSLLKNKVVGHLVNRPNEAFASDGEFPDPARLDATYGLAKTFCPLSSDSSQLSAVYAAAKGKSFVLEGPPGTGKSQTITNLIAHALATNQTVLFVSEKMAALDVVHRRLKDVGLERFCLQLHSAKSHKLEVIRQLGGSLEQSLSMAPEDWEQESRRIEDLRGELNAYPDSMHQPRATGESVFQGISKLIGLRDAFQITLRWANIEGIDREALLDLREQVGKLATAGEACGHPTRNTWAASKLEVWSPGFQRECEAAIDTLDKTAQALEETAAEVGPGLGTSGQGLSFKGLGLIGDLAELLLKSPEPAAPLLGELDWEGTNGAIAEWIARGRRRDGLREKLLARYTEALLNLDLDSLAARLTKANAAWKPIGWIQRMPIRGALAKAARDGRKPPAANLAEDLAEACALQAEEKVLAAAGDRARALLGQVWQDGRADWDALEQMATWVGSFRKLAAVAAGGNSEKTAKYRQYLAQLTLKGRAQLTPDGAVGRKLANFVEVWRRFREGLREIDKLLVLDSGAAWGGANEANAMSRVRGQLASWRQHRTRLQSWAVWRSTRREGLALNMAPLIQAYEEQALPSQGLRRIFDRAFYQWWVEAQFEADPCLKAFYSPEHERKIQRFRELDDRYLELTKQFIQARLAASIPTPNDRVNENSEMGILQKQLQRQRGHLPIRRLFEKIPNLLPRLKPCVLMSPISVAQYLDPAHPLFDLVVFDEASQIPVWDAVGAIARGKEAIIVGDPKQLPPTNFFSRADGEEPSDDDVVEDLESILDDCIGARIPKLHLAWHYRSRHESLIAFSNHRYYEDSLLTFPSPDTDSMGVQWRPVPNGIYEKGRTRTNRAEAEAVAAEILKRLADPILSQWSIGVVTFSVAQQTLIEDLLDAARRDRPEIEPYFSSDRQEPIFVKNLESVQGDERDVILFSICYGPDAQGRISMNFGPLNRDGGQRRLNVAITRARREVLVFSTLRADQIDLSRTRAAGAADLRLFLDYAERGPSAIAEAISLRRSGEFDSPFESQVYDRLVARGHTVHSQVGCSGYRIDLAVVDPAARGRYLLGIECDGANYHRARTARDRDRLRESILRGLGWSLHRIWSTDWWNDPESCMVKLEAAIARAVHVPAMVEPPKIDEPIPKPDSEAIAAPAYAKNVAPIIPKPSERKTAGADSSLRVYKPLPLKTKFGNISDFQGAESDRILRELLVAIAEHDGPVSLGLAARCICGCWEIGRVSSNMQKRLEQIARQADIRIVEHDEDLFLWPSAGDPAAYATFRVPGNDPESRRDARDLPPEEITNAGLHILRQQISLPIDDLVKEVARLFGFHRTGTNVDQAIRRGVDLMIRRGGVERREDRVVLVN